MRRTALLTGTLLTLALVPALHAQTWEVRVQGGPSRYGGYPQGSYSRYGGYPGYRNGYGSGYPEIGHMDRVSVLAHEIDVTATALHRGFEYNNRRPDWAENRAMLALHDLNREARHFHAEVESYAQSPWHTVNDFRRLERSFFVTERTLEAIGPRPYVDRGMERMYVSMNEIARLYGMRSGYGHWRSHGARDWSRYDQRGYGDRRHDGSGYPGAYTGARGGDYGSGAYDDPAAYDDRGTYDDQGAYGDQVPDDDGTSYDAPPPQR